MLHSVPTIDTDTRPMAIAPDPTLDFEQGVEQILTRHSAADALPLIVRLHQDEMRSMESRVYLATSEASAAAAESRTRHTMLLQLHDAAAHSTWGIARAAAETSALREVIEHVRLICQRTAQTGPHATVSAGTVLDALSHEPVQPVHGAHISAFVTDGRFRAGQFRSPSGDLTMVYTFTGWALVDHGPGTHGVLEPVFLVDDTAMPQSRVEAEHDVNLDALLPTP